MTQAIAEPLEAAMSAATPEQRLQAYRQMWTLWDEANQDAHEARFRCTVAYATFAAGDGPLPTREMLEEAMQLESRADHLALDMHRLVVDLL
jgi:hypothetical protein